MALIDDQVRARCTRVERNCSPIKQMLSLLLLFAHGIVLTSLPTSSPGSLKAPPWRGINTANVSHTMLPFPPLCTIVRSQDRDLNKLHHHTGLLLFSLGFIIVIKVCKHALVYPLKPEIHNVHIKTKCREACIFKETLSLFSIYKKKNI